MSSASLARLDATKDEKAQTEILDELCTMLCIGMEEYVRGFDVDFAVKVFVKVLQTAENDNVVVLCSRAIALVLEMIPRSCRHVVDIGTVPILIKYLSLAEHNPELAEEILKSCEKVSVDDPQAIVAAQGAVQAITASMEFTPAHLHKTTVSILSNVCRKAQQHGKEKSKVSQSGKGRKQEVHHDQDANMLKEVIPALLKIMEQSNNEASREVVERVCTCIANVADVRGVPIDGATPNARIAHLVKAGVLRQLARPVFQPVKTEQDQKQVDIMLKLLAILCSASPSLVTEFLLSQAGFETPFLQRLVELMLPDSTDYSQVLTLPFRTGGGLFGQTVDLGAGSSSSDYIPALLHLLSTMLPPLPSSALCYNHPQMVPQHTWAWEDDYHNFSPYDKNATEALEAAFCRRASTAEIVVRGMKYTVDLDQMKQRNRSSGVARNVLRYAIHSGFRRRCAAAPEALPPPAVELKSRMLGGLRAFLGSFDMEEDPAEEKHRLEENKHSPLDANPVEAASLATTSSYQVYRTSPSLAYEWLEVVMPALLQLANLTTDSSIRLWCVEILARILNLSVAATKHVQPASPKTFRALKSRLKSDGDWLGLNRRLKNAAFALTGFLGDVVARAESDSIVDHALYISGLLATVGTRSLRQLLQRSGLPTILQAYCETPEPGPPKSPRKKSESARPAAEASAVRQRLQQRARALLERHLAKADAEHRDDPPEAAEAQLRQMAAVLVATADPVAEQDAPTAAGEVIEQLLQFLGSTATVEKVPGSKDGGISTFEFLNSGIAEALLGYLTYDAPPVASNAVQLTVAKTRGSRLQKFACSLQSAPKAAAALLHYLQQSLSLAEKFPTQPECLFQPAGAAAPLLRPSATVREFIRLLHHRVFKVALVDGDAAPPLAEAPPVAEAELTGSTAGATEKGKGKRKRSKKAAGPKAAEEKPPVAPEKCTTVDPLATVGCIERHVARALEAGLPLGHASRSTRPLGSNEGGDGEHSGDEEEEDDLGLEFCLDDEDEEEEFLSGEEDEEEEDDEGDDFGPGFTFHVGDEMDVEAQILSRLTGSQSSGGQSPKVQVPRLRRQRYYLWMKGVGRLPQSATLLHAVANYHLSAQGCADLLLQIDRLLTSPNAAVPTSARALRELEVQRLDQTIRQQEFHLARLEEQAEEARASPPTPTGSKKKKKKTKAGAAGPSRAADQELQQEARRLQERLRHSADRHRQAADRMADHRSRLQQEFEELFPPSVASGFMPFRRRLPDTNGLWDTTYTIYYTKTPTPPPAIVASLSPSAVSGPTTEEAEHAAVCSAASPLDRHLSLAPAVPATFHTALASEAVHFSTKSTQWLQSGEVALPLLKLMRLLYVVDRHRAEGPALDRKDFHNPHMTAKLMQALAANAVAVALLGPAGLPTWCRQLTLQFRFLFPYEARKEYLTFTSFGALRSLYTYLTSNTYLRFVRADVQADHALGAIKARVDRQAILRDCDTVLFECADRRAPLDVMYNDEVGTGLGPTLELFTLVSQQLQRKSLGLWRGDTERHGAVVLPGQPWGADASASPASPIWDLPASTPEEYLDAKDGLFPINTGPEPDAAEAARLGQCFTMVGRFLARALQDGRLLDLRFAPVFFELLAHWPHWADRPTALAPQHVALMDAALGQSLQRVLDWAVQAADGPLAARPAAAATLQGMGLDFTAPGSDVPLLPDGDQTLVDETNAAHYVALVCRELLLRRARPHLQAILHGFEEALPGGALGIFDAEELEQLWCGHVTDISAPLWTREEMTGALVCMHGYTADSPEIADLLDILCDDFTPQQQQLFLVFLTGSPRLPPGGVSAVQPKITVVRKGVAVPQFAGGAEGDSAHSLPSCNTCFHYLKLPAYGSRQLLREKLLLAVEEGRGAFSLS
eukprot:EG_transcript_124